MEKSRTISISLSYTKYDRTGFVTVNRYAGVTLSHNTCLQFLQEFSKDAKKIWKEAVNLAEQGSCWSDFRIDETTFDENCHVLNLRTWTAEDYNYLGEDDNGKKYFHFDPDTEQSDNLPEWWDMVVYSDVLGSLAEAGL